MIDPRIYREMGLNDSEYAEIEKTLGREPSMTELGMYAVMWSEHCGYKYSRPVLRLFKKYKEAMDTGAVENAGVVDIGDGQGIVMKMESHNHPSAVEPFQGAATGVGGILRDIFTMGARPIANLNSLRFGPLDDARTRYLFNGVVEGIAHYGNCLIASERLVWRDSQGIHFDTIGRFVEDRLPAHEMTWELTDKPEVLSLDSQTLEGCWRPIRRIFKRRSRNLVKLKTAMGRTLTVTPDHPMLMLEEGAWKIRLAQTLKKGDCLPILLSGPDDCSTDLPKIDLVDVLSEKPDVYENVFVGLPAEWTISEDGYAALCAEEPSAYRRHRYLKKGYLPFPIFRQIESHLAVDRASLTLYRRSGKANYMRAVITADALFARLLGYYLAEGCISSNGETYKIIWTFAHHEQEYINEVVHALKSLGLRACVEMRSSTIAVTSTSWLFALLLKNYWGCGDRAENKAIPAASMLWPRTLQREILKGLLRGDGSLTTRTHGSHAKITFASTSRTLFEQVTALVQQEGAVPSIYTRPVRQGTIQGRTVQCVPSWHLEVQNRAGLLALADMFGTERTALLAKALNQYEGDKWSFPRFQSSEGLVVVKITEATIISCEQPIDVYDIEVDDTHLFVTTSGLITHNCVGVPTVGGEIYFHPSYAGNPLVNAMSVGIVPTDKVASAGAKGVGNPVLYVGSATGKDGIHGATFASVELGPDSESKRPNVQMGDPFAEKLLIEATLEALATGYVVGIQDMGAAGLTCSTCETAAKAGMGMDVEIRKVPQRETGMTPYEIMLSESQERMLAIIEKGHEGEVAAIFHKWGLNAAVVGTVTDTGRVVIRDEGQVVADVPAKSLTDDCPVYSLEAAEPAYIREVQSADLAAFPEPEDLGAVLIRLLGAPSIASKRWVYDQYDSMVQTQTTVLPGAADAAVVRLRGTNKAIALTTDCNPRYCYLDPYVGAQIAVAEAARNLSCVGAAPLAVTDCLNFANPEKPDNFWTFRKAVEGLADACEAFGTPVISGNVSFYNETPERAIYPTPTVGMLGLIPEADKRVTQGFRQTGDLVLKIGDGTPTFGGSEYLSAIHGQEVGAPPSLEIDAEKRLHAFLRDAIGQGLVQSAHDVSDGGLAVALAESALTGGLGLQGTAEAVTTLELFGERTATVILSVLPASQDALASLAQTHDLPIRPLGTVGGDRFQLAGRVDLPLTDLRAAYEDAIPNAMRGEEGASGIIA